MTPEKNSISSRKQKNKMKSPHKNIKLGKSPTHSGSNPIVESSNGKTKNCHQCRHFKAGYVAVWCMNQTEDNNKCSYVYCDRCLINRYGEKAEEIDNLEKWICPRCRGICNCSICMKKRGHEPTGNLTAKRQAPGLSRVSDMQIESREIIPNTDIAPDKDLTSVAGFDMPSEQVGNALQFLEFCACFGKILDFKKGEPEYVLQDLLDDQAERQEKFSAAVQFHIYLLRIIQEERGQENEKFKSPWFDTLKKLLTGSLSVLEAQGFECFDNKTDYDSLDSPENLILLNILCDEVLETKCAGNLLNGKSKSQWFDMLKKLLSGAQNVLKAHGFECFDNKANYDTLDSSEKLILLNILCDEVLETKKVKNWVGGQSRKVAGKDKDTSLKRTRGHDVDNAIFSRYTTLRTDPIYKQQGYVFWKLNALGESDILCQNVGKGDVLTLDEKWSSVNVVTKEAIEKHISLSREQTKGRSRVCIIPSELGQSEETE